MCICTVLTCATACECSDLPIRAIDYFHFFLNFQGLNPDIADPETDLAPTLRPASTAAASTVLSIPGMPTAGVFGICVPLATCQATGLYSVSG